MSARSGALASILLVTSAASAQVTHVPSYPFHGYTESAQFGYSVSSAGDVNDDGFPDLIVGAPFDSNIAENSGRIQVFSGFDGAILYTIDGEAANTTLGWSVSGAGKVNAGSHADFIVGAPLNGNNGGGSGSARVYSGTDGSVLYAFDGDSGDDNFGVSVSGAGDVNNDGLDDFIVGAYRDDNNGSNSGSATVFSGADGSILYTFNGDSADDFFGFSVSGAGDVNNDGFDDVIVGAYQDDNNGGNSGSARVFSGADGSILYTFNGDSGNDRLGWAVSDAGDVNNDGFADLIVGAYLDDNNGSNSGSARVFSGFDGSILYTFSGDSATDQLGYSVSGAGDVNSDGFDDLIAGARQDDNNGSSSGSARVYSGLDGSILYTFNGESIFDAFGYSVSGAGDVNGDGFDDLIVGANSKDNNGLVGAGSATVIRSYPLPTPPAPCPGNANGDTVVNFDDINAVIANWLNVCP